MTIRIGKTDFETEWNLPDAPSVLEIPPIPPDDETVVQAVFKAVQDNLDLIAPPQLIITDDQWLEGRAKFWLEGTEGEEKPLRDFCLYMVGKSLIDEVDDNLISFLSASIACFLETRAFLPVEERKPVDELVIRSMLYGSG
jgi:hypothetical protein